MDLSFSKEDLDFRQEVVDFLDNNYPADIKEMQDKRLPLDKEQNIRWQKSYQTKVGSLLIGLQSTREALS